MRGEGDLLAQDERVVGQQEAKRLQVLRVEQLDRDRGLQEQSGG
jgi:hypothetical protein